MKTQAKQSQPRETRPATEPPPRPDHGFPPLEASPCRLLLLGSMPGRESLARRQYYAHPRNAFWPLVCTLLGGDPAAPYPERCRLLTAHGISLWDVLAACIRPGSLDASIVRQSEIPNPLAGFCRRHPELKAIACNGRGTEALLRRHFLKPQPELCNSLKLISLPSTSPANARLRPSQKLALWRKRLAPFLPQV